MCTVQSRGNACARIHLCEAILRGLQRALLGFLPSHLITLFLLRASWLISQILASSVFGEPYHTHNHLLDVHCLHLGPRGGPGFGVHPPFLLVLSSSPKAWDPCVPFAAQLTDPEPVSLPGEFHSNPTQLFLCIFIMSLRFRGTPSFTM